jgi:putative membrane protein
MSLRSRKSNQLQWLTRGLIVVCGITWAATAIAPYDLEAWVLEQIAAAIGVGLILWARIYVSFSASARIGMASLFILHAIGTHYTYSLTPYDEFFRDWLDISINDGFGWQRNHYDRFVHVAFGLTTALPFYESLRTMLRISRGAAWFLSVNLVISASALYELMEWLAAEVFSADAGTLYLGSQGDTWDAQWDIALAIFGAAIICACSLVAGKLRKLT